MLDARRAVGSYSWRSRAHRRHPRRRWLELLVASCCSMLRNHNTRGIDSTLTSVRPTTRLSGFCPWSGLPLRTAPGGMRDEELFACVRVHHCRGILWDRMRFSRRRPSGLRRDDEWQRFGRIRLRRKLLGGQQLGRRDRGRRQRARGFRSGRPRLGGLG
jgi:hypothetical protein